MCLSLLYFAIARYSAYSKTSAAVPYTSQMRLITFLPDDARTHCALIPLSHVVSRDACANKMQTSQADEIYAAIGGGRKKSATERTCEVRTGAAALFTSNVNLAFVSLS